MQESTIILIPFLKDICQRVNSGYWYSRENKTNWNLEKLWLGDRSIDTGYRNRREEGAFVIPHFLTILTCKKIKDISPRPLSKNRKQRIFVMGINVCQEIYIFTLFFKPYILEIRVSLHLLPALSLVLDKENIFCRFHV